MTAAMPTLFMRNAAAVQAKLDRMKALGLEELQIIADFDMTLTRFRLLNGERAYSSHRVVEASPLLGDDFQQKSKALFEHYYPIEIDPHLSAAEKIPLMTEWWEKAHDLMIGKKLNQAHLKEMVKTPGLALRDGVPELLRLAHELKVPVHVFSAGLYDVIHAFFEERGLLVYCPHVVSNMMEFNRDGFLVGFKGTLIHSFNKNSSALKGSQEWERVVHRRSVVLLGDNPTDIHMVAGFDAKEVLSIGFLNDKVEERKEAYMDTFDVVLLNDGPVDYIIDLVRLISVAGRSA